MGGGWIEDESGLGYGVSRRIIVPATLVVGLGAVALGLGVAVGFGSKASALGPPHFVAESAGVDQTYDGPFTFATGGGVAAFDCDDDGRAELYVAGGSRPAALYRNRSAAGGALAFAQAPSPVTDLSGVTGAYPLDIDSDGKPDLAVLRAGENVLLRGLGDCRFERANERWKFDGGSDLTTAFSATWEGAADLPMLAFGNYLGLDATGETTRSCVDNQFYRPAKQGSGYAAATSLTPGYCSLSMLFSDWDRSGRRDLRVSNDRQYYTDGEEQLWRVVPGEAPRAYGAADGWVRLQIWGMGIASNDLTGDGFPEVYLTSQADNKLQTLADGPARPAFRDVALARGVTATRPFTGDQTLPSTAWHPEFADVNNDGFIDLFVSKGNVLAQEGFAVRDPSNLFLGRPDGSFLEGADQAGILNFERGRGAALVDLNLDGLLDLVEVNFRAPTRIWRNVGSGTSSGSKPMGNWLQIRVREPAPNVDAIGAWLEVRVGDRIQRRELVVGGGHVGGQLGWTHLGLGGAERADVRVTWPDGEVGAWQSVGANHFLTIDRSVAAPQVWQP
jgi:hypothetical protein